MIKLVREYFEGIIRTVDNSLMNIDDDYSGMNNLDSIYSITFGQMSPQRIDSTIESNLSVSVVVYKKLSVNNKDSDFDSGYCRAVDIHALAMTQEMIDQSEVIKSVTCDSIVPAELDDDSLAYSYTLSFNVLLAYKYNFNN